MDKEKLESLIIDYIDNKLNSVDRQPIEKLLTTDADAYKLYEDLREVIQVMDKASRIEPTSKLQSGFDDMLKQEISTTKQSKSVFFQPAFYRVAAAVALLIVGGGLGFWLSKQYDQQQRLAAIEKEMTATKLMMMSMLDNHQSASQRMQGVNVALNIDKADHDIIKALVKTMNEDPNSNVRLAALEALSKFTSDASVRRALIASLTIQKDPVVQIALIQLMVKMKEREVVKDLQRIVDDNETMKAVKDEAYSGILKLS
jgi:HEAT repeat protein